MRRATVTLDPVLGASSGGGAGLMSILILSAVGLVLLLVACVVLRRIRHSRHAAHFSGPRL